MGTIGGKSEIIRGEGEVGTFCSAIHAPGPKVHSFRCEVVS
jgi:hypothetical protein